MVVVTTDDVAPKVLFIGGYGRSGSTLLDRVVGSTEGFFSAGELRHIWLEGYAENRLCGCGNPFRSCPFWSEVSERAFRPFGGLDIDELLAVKGRVDRYQRVGQLATGVASRRRRRDLRWYGDRLRALYGAIGAVSGAEVVVDSSKDVSHGYVLGALEPSLDLYLLHLVRDSRAVAWSWRRKKYNPGSGDDMQRYGLLRASSEWVAINALTAMQRRLGVPYLRLHYEQFVGDPARALSQILDLVGESHREVKVDDRGSIELRAGHTVAGNPNRFTEGVVAIRSDEEWRARMPTRDRAVVSALTLPALLGLGYLRQLR